VARTLLDWLIVGCVGASILLGFIGLPPTYDDSAVSIQHPGRLKGSDMIGRCATAAVDRNAQDEEVCSFRPRGDAA
jgi:hypothetical protein